MRIYHGRETGARVKEIRNRKKKLTGTDDRADLNYYVVSGGGNSTFLHVERVFTDPRGDNRMKIWVLK